MISKNKAAELAKLLATLILGISAVMAEDMENADGWQKMIEYLMKASDLLIKIQKDAK